MNRLTRIPAHRFVSCMSLRSMSSNPRGDGGSSSDSGGAGSIRGAGGKFAERESALENEYFYKLQAQQLKKLKEHIHDEISHHEKEIKRHQEAIERHKQRSKDLDKHVEK